MDKLPTGPQDRSATLVGAATTTFVLGSIFVSLRFLCRVKAKVGLWWDDWLLLAGWSVATAKYLVSVIIIRHYAGRHLGDVDLAGMVEYGKAYFFCELGYCVCLTIVKLSILALYWRIFSYAAMWPIVIMAVLTLIWGITWFFCLLFQCYTIPAAWQLLDPNRKCMDLRSLLVYGPLPHIIGDLILILLPIPYIARLSMKLSQRLVLCSIFLIGGFIIVVSILRFVYIITVDFNNIDATWTFTNVAIWSAVELDSSFICACLPCLRPIIRFATQGTFVAAPGDSTSVRSPAQASNRPNKFLGNSSRAKPKRSWWSQIGATQNLDTVHAAPEESDAGLSSIELEKGRAVIDEETGTIESGSSRS